jgi:predicted Ser/Thr protein kinase
MLGQALPRLRTNMAPPKIGRELSFEKAKHKFHGLKKLGQGAFGAAFAATMGGHPVIVKTAVGMPGLVSLHEAIDSMKHEVNVLALLQRYPFVPRLVEIGFDYFVQEDVKGVSLLNLLAKRGLEPGKLLSTVVSSGIIASVLHREGVGHNDLEARNILLTPQGVVVIDFGISVLKSQGQKRFQAAMERDIVSLLEDVILVLSSRKLPMSIRIMLASTIEKFRKVILAGRVNENTAQDLSRELLFATAQLGARANRDGKIKDERIKVEVANVE